MKTTAKPVCRILPFHHLASGRIISAGQVVRAVRIVRSQPLDTYYRETFTSEYGGGTGREVLRAFSDYCQNEINRRGSLLIRNPRPATFDRIQRMLCKRARPSECKWCGQSLGRYVPSDPFCDASCARSYRC